MNSKSRALMAAVVLLIGPSRHAPALPVLRSVPPASFLNYHVDTVRQLDFEVTYDRVVQERLAHHFHLAGPAMCTYVRANLALERLTAPYRTRVYCLNPRGREYFVVTTLKPGTPVFALRGTGRPILKLACGNPLTSALPPAAKKAMAHAAQTPPHTRPKAEGTGRVVAAHAAPRASASPPVTSVAGAAFSAGGGGAMPLVTISPALSAQIAFTQQGGGASRLWGGAWVPLAGGLIAVLSHNTGSTALNSGGEAGNTGSVSSFIPASGSPTGAGSPPTGLPGPALPGPTGLPGPVAGVIPPYGGPSPIPSPEPSPAWVFLTGALVLTAGRLTAVRGARSRRPSNS